jgi:hypothetical protein
MQLAANNTASAAAQIRSIEEVAAETMSEVQEIMAWTERLSAGAVNLDGQVESFFGKVRALE